MPDIYQRLAEHLEPLTLGLPPSEELLAILRETFSPEEARAALAIPNRLPPLEVAPLAGIAAQSDLALEELAGLLEGMAAKGALFSAPAAEGGMGYSLMHVGYGMPQTFFWGGQNDERTRRMAKLVYRYFRPEVTRKVYGDRPTKVFKYSPAALTVQAPVQGVYTFELIEDIVSKAQRIAVAHCPCRLGARILGRDDCRHSLEVCFKYDELADFVVAKGLARPVSADETLSIMAACEKEGLVHMVDNAASRHQTHLQLLRPLLLERGAHQKAQGAPRPAHGLLFSQGHRSGRLHILRSLRGNLPGGGGKSGRSNRPHRCGLVHRLRGLRGRLPHRGHLPGAPGGGNSARGLRRAHVAAPPGTGPGRRMSAAPTSPARVLLVQPYPPEHALLADDPLEFSQPLGLMYLAAAVRAQGHKVALADLNLIQAAGPQALGPWLEELDPQVVGLSAPFSLMSPAVRELAAFVKQVSPGALVAAGGAHASACPAEVLAWPEVDLVFLGESEDSFCEYLAGADAAGIDGLAYRVDGRIAVNPKRCWIKDLDRLPFPARDLVDLTAYWERSGRAGQGRWTSFITSRGCPYACVFCSVHTVWGRRWRPRGPQNVVAELRELKERFGLDTLSLEDDNFTLKLDRAKEILRLLLAEGLEFKWATPNGLRADRLDEELIKLMKQAGFTQAKVAIESGHPRVNRKVIGKKLDLDKAKEVVALAAREGLPPSAFFVLGFPGETPEEMLTTISYALQMRELGLMGADFFMATPYPGTDLLKQCQEQDLLLLPPEELPLANAFRPSLATSDWDAPLLWFMVRLARRAFARRRLLHRAGGALRQRGCARSSGRGQISGLL